MRSSFFVSRDFKVAIMHFSLFVSFITVKSSVVKSNSACLTCSSTSALMFFSGSIMRRICNYNKTLVFPRRNPPLKPTQTSDQNGSLSLSIPSRTVRNPQDGSNLCKWISCLWSLAGFSTLMLPPVYSLDHSSAL